MSQLERFSVSVEQDLLGRFDRLIEARGNPTRSEALRDLMRQELVNAAWENPGSEVFGTVTILYDHHAHGLAHALADLQHDHCDAIVSSCRLVTPTTRSSSTATLASRSTPRSPWLLRRG